ncbi:MAG TPA: hypothetical protein VMF66_21140 [Candidatus Acidoferrum sp.]|nr:hypothetical protein [Candidatus Acidoferrum sp.]
MADNVRVTTVVSRPNWGAIWAGVFTFLGIWTVWGLLGMGVFSSAANPAAPAPVGGMHVGITIWSIILTIVALFFAGRVTGHLAGIGNRRDGAVHGMIMFGLSMVSAVVAIALIGRAISPTGMIGGAHNPFALGIGASLGYGGFVGTLLGWFAAMWGASIGTHMIRGTAVEEAGARRAA